MSCEGVVVVQLPSSPHCSHSITVHYSVSLYNSLLYTLQKGKLVLWKASFEGHTEIVLLLLRHHAAVDLPNDVRHSNAIYTVNIDA